MRGGERNWSRGRGSLSREGLFTGGLEGWISQANLRVKGVLGEEAAEIQRCEGDWSTPSRAADSLYTGEETKPCVLTLM